MIPLEQLCMFCQIHTKENLKDEATAAKNHIYEKKAAENGTVQITAAGDLCLEEDGYVLDYYDTVNDLSNAFPRQFWIRQMQQIFSS